MKCETKAGALKLLVEFFEKNKRAPSFYKEYELWLKLISYTTRGNRCYDEKFSTYVRDKYEYGNRKHRVATKRRDRTDEINELKTYIETHGVLPLKGTKYHSLRVLHNRITYEGHYLYNKSYTDWYKKKVTKKEVRQNARNK